jgi:tetratricopeptide (TPR) repeat protein
MKQAVLATLLLCVAAVPVNELVAAGQALARQSRFAEAQQVLEQALHVRPLDFPIHLTLGSVLRAGSRPSEALGVLYNAVELKPKDNWRAHLQIAYTLLESKRSQKDAEKSLRAAIKQAPWLDQAHLELSELCQGQNRLDEARHSLEAVAELQPDRGEILFSIATLALQQGEPVSSKSTMNLLRRAVQLSPALTHPAVDKTFRAAVNELAIRGVLGTSEHDWLLDYGYEKRGRSTPEQQQEKKEEGGRKGQKRKKRKKSKKTKRQMKAETAETKKKSPCRGRGFSAFTAALSAPLFQRLVKEVQELEPKLTPFDSAVGWWVPAPLALTGEDGRGEDGRGVDGRAPYNTSAGGARCAIEEAVLSLHRLAAHSCQQHPFLGDLSHNSSSSNSSSHLLSAIAGGEWWIQRRGGPKSRNASTNFHW